MATARALGPTVNGGRWSGVQHAPVSTIRPAATVAPASRCSAVSSRPAEYALTGGTAPVGTTGSYVSDSQPRGSTSPLTQIHLGVPLGAMAAADAVHAAAGEATTASRSDSDASPASGDRLSVPPSLITSMANGSDSSLATATTASSKGNTGHGAPTASKTRGLLNESTHTEEVMRIQCKLKDLLASSAATVAAAAAAEAQGAAGSISTSETITVSRSAFRPASRRSASADRSSGSRTARTSSRGVTDVVRTAPLSARPSSAPRHRRSTAPPQITQQLANLSTPPASPLQKRHVMTSLDIYADPDSYEKGVLAAIHSDSLLLEKHQFQKATARGRHWLKTVLDTQVSTFDKQLIGHERHFANEMLRQEIVDKQRLAFEEARVQRLLVNDQRHQLTEEHRKELQRLQEEEQAEKVRQEHLKLLRLEQKRLQQEEETAVALARLEEKRRVAYEEAVRVAEERRRDIASRARIKDVKIDVLINEKRNLWQARRAASIEASRAMEMTQEEIAHQHVYVKYDVDRVRELTHGLTSS
eukprot:TRINITY_DN37974_c0_g1_i1.p1 TRINITY_DN37974_c0_g1~~TRINITY_DN37974_c0_g1_i1.p1  ORF type:complete len:531 (-),score=110.86 TRINITY_DN37974_c0_g1_i1:107-1699(-)